MVQPNKTRDHPAGAEPIPFYYFNLKDQQAFTIDPDGAELADDAQAHTHARAVASELMQHREVQTRSWRLQVCDAARRPCFEVLFASVDESIAHLPTAMRNTLENFCRTSASLSDAIVDMQMTLIQLKGTMARAEGMPYLAALNGKWIGGTALF